MRDAGSSVSELVVRKLMSQSDRQVQRERMGGSTVSYNTGSTQQSSTARTRYLDAFRVSHMEWLGEGVSVTVE